MPAASDTPARWAPDPTGRHQLRYWNGSRWTDHVSDQGVTAVDAMNQPSAVETDRRVLTRLTKVKYLGSHPRHGGQADSLTLEFTTTGLRILAARSELATIPWNTVQDIAADEREGVERRITASRIALLGGFALLAKKERVLSYFVASDTDGDWIFAVPGLTQMELAAGVRPLRKYVGGSLAASEPEKEERSHGARDDVAARLDRLRDLRDQDLITEQEHQERRSRILDEI